MSSKGAWYRQEGMRWPGARASWCLELKVHGSLELKAPVRQQEVGHRKCVLDGFPRRALGLLEEVGKVQMSC